MNIKEPFRKKFIGYQTWNATIDEVFPLICPNKCTFWKKNWNPNTIYSNSSVIETDCIFTSTFSETTAIWIVDKHDTIHHSLSIYQIVPDLLINKYEINLFSEQEGKTHSEIKFVTTALSLEGRTFIKDYTQDNFNYHMTVWEKELNIYLQSI